MRHSSTINIDGLTEKRNGSKVPENITESIDSHSNDFDFGS